MRTNLKEARKAKGMTQQQMADYLCMSHRHYQRIESGFTLGTFEAWDALEDLLEIHQRKLREISDNRHVQVKNQ